MPTSLLHRLVPPGSARFRLLGVVLALLTAAQLPFVLAAAPDGAAAATNRTRLSTGVPDAVAPEIAAEGRTLHSVWADAGLFGAPARGVAYRRSLDGGTTWSSIRQLDVRSGKGHAEWPKVAVDGSTVVVTWSETTGKDVPDMGNRQIWAAVSTDAGATFSSSFRVDEDRFDSESPQVAVRGDDVWISWGDLAGDVYTATSHDRGATFEVHQLADRWGAPLVDGGLAVDGDTVAVTWQRNEGEKDKDIEARVSTDRGDTWGATVAIADTPDHVWDWYPVVAAADGEVHVTWQQEDNRPPRSKRVGTRRMVRTSVDGGASFGDPVDLGAGGGHPAVAQRDGLVAFAWGSGTGVQLATRSAGGWAQSFVAGGNGRKPDLAVVRGTSDGGPRARFTWTMPERYGMDADGDGLVDQRTDELHVSPPLWTVTFDGCASDAGTDDPDGDLSYEWTLDGDPFGPDACSFEHQFTEEGRHTVRLEVTRANGRKHSTSHVVDVDDLLIVSIGDSVASGEGNPDISGTGPFPWSQDSVWQDRQCNRSAKAGPALAAAEIERRDPRRSVTFLHLACSGATVYGPDNSTGGLLSPYEGIRPSHGELLDPQLDQVEALVGDREIDAVFLSIGANDLRFSDVVKDCLLNFGCHEDDEDVRSAFDARLAELPEHYDRLAHRLDQLGVEDVYITEYFDPTVDHEGAWNLSCAANLGQAGLSDSETRWAAEHVMGNLNGSVRAAAEEHGWHFVGGIADEFIGHGYCAEDSYVVQLTDSFAEQADEYGAFHPNEEGHRIYGRRIAEEMAASTQPVTEPPGAPGPDTDDWGGDLYLSWGDHDVMVTTLRVGGGPAVPVRTVQVTEAAGTEGTRFASLAAGEHGAYVAWDESDAVDPTSYLGHWHAYAAPAVQAPPNLTVGSATLTQGVDDAGFLVADRSTVVAAEITSTLSSPQTVYVRYRIRDGVGGIVTEGTVPVALSPGHNEVYLEGQNAPLVPDDGIWWAEVVVDPDGLVREHDEDDNVASTEEHPIRRSRALRTLYVPVGGTSCAGAEGVARSSSPWLHGVLPVPDGALTQHTDCGYAMAGSNGDDADLTRTLAMLDSMALLSGYDTAVGVVPSGWLQSPTGGAVGLGLYGDPAPSGAPAGGILVEQGQGPSVVAHEIGHNFGLDHTEEVPADGYWVAARTRQDGIDLMDRTVQRTPWVGPGTWSTLMERFQLTAEQEPVELRTVASEDGGPRSLLVRGTVAPDGTVDVPPWYQLDEAPDVALGSSSNLVLEYRGAGGAVIASAGVHASGLESLGGAGLEGWESFGARVPWVEGTTGLVLRRGAGGAVLVERDVTPAAPEVAIVSPVESTWAAVGGELDVRWTATDADGGDLQAALSFSTDGGVTFKPVAMDLEGASTTWHMGDHLAGKPIRVRLDVTDGVRTTSAVSDTFTVGGTPPETARLAVIRNVQPEGGGVPFTHLYTMLPDGSDLRHVPTVGHSVGDPHWSPDGGRIAFSTDGDPDDHVTSQAVYSVRPDGSELTNLTPSPTDGSWGWRFECPQWHPDGSKVLVHVSRRDHHTVNELAWAAADGSGLTTVVDDVTRPAADCPRLSPDGTRVAVTGDAGVEVIDLVDGTRTLVSPKSRGYHVAQPVWTPDGGSIIHQLATGPRHDPKDFWGLAKVPADGSRPADPFLSMADLEDPYNPGGNLAVNDPRFTPDGSRILFHGWDGRVQYTEGWKHRLHCSINPDGTGLTCLQGERLSDLGGGFLEADMAPGGTATPPPPPWIDPPPVVSPPSAGDADAGGPYEAVEDQPFRLDAGASGLAAGAGVPLASWDLDDDGDFDDAFGLRTTGVVHDAGTRTVRVRVTTADGREAEASSVVEVSRAAPQVRAPAPITALAGRPYELEGASFLDPGLEGHHASASWGDGSNSELEVQVDGAVAGLLRGAHTWDAPGTYELVLTVCDEGTDVCGSAATTVTVVAPSRGGAPVAEDISIRTSKATPVSVQLGATDPEGDPIDRSILQAPLNGRVVPTADDTVEYVPDSSFTGVDAFTWVASDGEGTSAPATVTVAVGNAAPVAGDDAVEVRAGSPVVIASAALLANDEDPDGDELRLVGAYVGSGQIGTIERTDDGVRFEAPEGTEGEVQFDYAVSDGNGGIAFAAVVVTVRSSVPTTPTTAPPPTTDPPTTDPTTPTTTPPPTGPAPSPTDPPGPAPTVDPNAPQGDPSGPHPQVPTPGALDQGDGEVAGPSEEVAVEGRLPVTGASLGGLVLLGGALILSGGVILRSRRPAERARPLR